MKPLIAVFVLFLIGCGATGPGFSGAGTQTTPIAAGQARIVFFRTRESVLYVARRARISLDGNKVAALAYGGFVAHDVAAGRFRLSASMWDSPGRCELTLDAGSGTTYYFQVDPRGESFGAFAAAGFATNLVSGGVLSDVAGGLAGNALESYGRECGGAFRLYPVDAVSAAARLSDLRRSD